MDKIDDTSQNEKAKACKGRRVSFRWSIINVQSRVVSLIIRKERIEQDRQSLQEAKELEKDDGNENNSIDGLKEYKIRKDIEEELLRAAFERLNLTSSNIWCEIKKEIHQYFYSNAA